MPTSQLVFFNTFTLAAAATPASLYDKVTDTALAYALPKNLPGQCVSMQFSADVPTKVGFSASQLSDSLGATLPSNTPFSDTGTGAGGNTIPIGQIYLYVPTASGTATYTCYLRFIG